MTEGTDDAALANLRQELADDELWKTILASFVDETAQLLAQLDACLANGDQPGATRAAHTLKSASRQLGAVALADAASETETLLRDGQTGPARDRLPALRARADQAVAWVRTKM